MNDRKHLKSNTTFGFGPIDQDDFSYYEYKYQVDDTKLPQIIDLLNHFIGGLDPFPEGTVDSIYYDTLDQTCLSECDQGLAEKVKFRIRGYGNQTYGQLHIKKKNLCSVTKIKMPIKKVYGHFPDQYNSISRLEPQNSGDENVRQYCLHFKNNYGTMIPSVRIKYHRYRFRYLDYRLTLDTNIQAFSVAGGIPRQSNVVTLPHHVLEIKTRDLRPTIPVMGVIKLPQISYSKFMLGIMHLENET